MKVCDAFGVVLSWDKGWELLLWWVGIVEKVVCCCGCMGGVRAVVVVNVVFL